MKKTPSLALAENALASNPGSTPRARRKACASPAALVVAREDLAPPLPNVERASGGTEKMTFSPATGSPVSASTRRTRSGVEPDSKSMTEAVLPPGSTSVPGPPTTCRILRRGTIPTMNVTWGASNAGALASTSAEPVWPRAVTEMLAMPSSPVVASCAPATTTPGSPSTWNRTTAFGTPPTPSRARTTRTARVSPGWRTRSVSETAARR